MARSLGLVSYLPYGRRDSDEGSRPGSGRPKGELVWYHATEQVHADFAPQLAERLAAARKDLHLLLTTNPDVTPRRKINSSVIWQPVPGDTVAAAETFLKHWQPDICIWSVGDLKLVMLSSADKKQIPLILVDADETRLTRPGWRWIPDAAQSLLRRFTLILARTEEAEQFLRRRLGGHDVAIEVTGPVREGTKTLAFDESDRDELSAVLRGRPVWLAARLRADEIEVVLDAQNAINRMAHRALLIVVPDDPDNSRAFHVALNRRGWRYITWSEGELPDESTRVILANTRGELGLWYRIAPISFMGGSLSQGAAGNDPNEPAAHGSAILYGPNIRDFLRVYKPFAEAGAARIVRDAETLAGAVQQLIPPDQSAAMAHAAWDVATQGARVTDRLFDAIQDLLDQRARV